MKFADRIRRMTDVELASLLSSLSHCADYENDDYDPAIMKWLEGDLPDIYKICTHCGVRLTEEEIEYYSNACEKCEREHHEQFNNQEWGPDDPCHTVDAVGRS